MNTPLKEWLNQTIVELEEERDATPGAVNEDAAMALAAMKITLASLEAKPIGAFHIADQKVDGTSDYIKDGEWPIDDGVIEVYAAPPAPMSVPEECPAEIRELMSSHSDDLFNDEDAQEIWNACRAAMLQGAEPVTTANKLGSSPEIPDGYVLVPKEPTEEMLRASYHEASVYSAKAYRAMLAAAPQQEV